MYANGDMGTDAADYDRSGHPHLLVENFSKQLMTLYHNDGSSLFSDVASSTSLAFQFAGCDIRSLFLRYDLDGFPDIIAVNGHIARISTAPNPTRNSVSRR